MSEASTREAREQKLLNNPAALCNMMRRIALSAGEIILDYYDRLELLSVESKSNDTPVTQADREAELFIKEELKALCPSVPMIGEETVSLGQADILSEGDDYFWLVDPLDGTKNFIQGGEEFTVNIALIKDGVPVIGVVYAPVKGELYAASHGEEPVRWTDETEKDKPFSVRPIPMQGLVVISNRMGSGVPELERFLEQFKVQKMVRRASSLKICAVASGKADLYPRFGPTCEWDTAAGDAILRAAGGYLTDMQGQPLTYGRAEDGWLNPEFVASSFPWFEAED